MNFKTIERTRQKLFKDKRSYFSSGSKITGTYLYNKKIIDKKECLNNEFAAENIYELFRDDAINFFQDRNITWHDGILTTNGKKLPSNHLLDSQVFCINSLFYFIDKPLQLTNLLNKLGFNVKEILPFNEEKQLSTGKYPYLTFEWIGRTNYLKELYRGKVANDEVRKRGSGFTSSDFAFKFRNINDEICLVLGEWKYTEHYNDDNLQFSSSGRDRLNDIYKEFLEKYVEQKSGLQYVDLFYHPFDQLMRLQLLSSEIQNDSTLDYSKVYLLLICPDKNKEYLDKIYNHNLKSLGNTVPEIWRNIAEPDSFLFVNSESLLHEINNLNADEDWRKYLTSRCDFSDIPIKYYSFIDADKIRTESLNQFINIFGDKPIVPKFDFPSNIFPFLKENRLIIAVNLEEREKFKSKYELETWAFALYYSLNDSTITEISFYLFTDINQVELNEQKWIHLLLHRISFFNQHKSVNVELNCFTINFEDKITELPIKDWDLIVKDINSENVCNYDEVKKRRDKTERNLEDKEQVRIINQLKLIHPSSFVFKEFPISYKNEKGLSDTKRKRGNRIDILFMNDGILSIIELKVHTNNELDVIAQILDYYIYALRYSTLFPEFGWDKLINITEIKCIILCEHKHPLLDNVAAVYKKFGFSNLEIITKENGSYKGLI